MIDDSSDFRWSSLTSNLTRSVSAPLPEPKGHRFAEWTTELNARKARNSSADELSPQTAIIIDYAGGGADSAAGLAAEAAAAVAADVDLNKSTRQKVYAPSCLSVAESLDDNAA